MNKAASPFQKIRVAVQGLKGGKEREFFALLGAASSVLNKGISVLAVVFYVSWTLPYLGEQRFGIWMTLSSIVLFISVFSDLGLGSSLVNQVAFSKTHSGSKGVKEQTSSAFFTLVIMSVIMGGTFFFLSGPITQFIGKTVNEASVMRELELGLYYLIGLFFIGLPFITIEKTLEGLQLSYVSALCTMVGGIISLVIIYFITERKLGIPYLIIGTIGVQSFLRIIFFLVTFYFKYNEFSPSLKLINLESAQKLIKSGIIFFILNIFNVLAFQVDSLLISGSLGVEYVSMFSLMQKLVSVSFFFWFYTVALWPAFADAYSKGDNLWIHKTIIFVVKLNIAFGVFFGLIIIFGSNQILSFWSKGIIEAASLTMRLGFAFYIILNGLLGAASLIYNTGPHLKKHATLFCMAAFCSLILKWMLINKLGADYLMFWSILPFVFIYLIPCYVRYKKLIMINSADTGVNQNKLILIKDVEAKVE